MPISGSVGVLPFGNDMEPFLEAWSTLHDLGCFSGSPCCCQKSSVDWQIRTLLLRWGQLLCSHKFVSNTFVTPWIIDLQAPLSMGFLESKSDSFKRSVLHDLGTLVVIFRPLSTFLHPFNECVISRNKVPVTWAMLSSRSPRDSEEWRVTSSLMCLQASQLLDSHEKDFSSFAKELILGNLSRKQTLNRTMQSSEVLAANQRRKVL